MSAIYEANQYKIRVGTYMAIDMESSSYAWENFPLQADQPADLPWFPPMDPSGAWSEVEEIIDALDGSRSGFGGWNGSWYIAAATPNMISHIRSTIFSNGWSADVTIVTWDRGYGWRVINCKALWNEPARTAETVYPLGYYKLKIDFVNGVTAAAGVGFSIGFSLGFDS